MYSPVGRPSTSHGDAVRTLSITRGHSAYAHEPKSKNYSYCKSAACYSVSAAFAIAAIVLCYRAVGHDGTINRGDASGSAGYLLAASCCVTASFVICHFASCRAHQEQKRDTLPFNTPNAIELGDTRLRQILPAGRAEHDYGSMRTNIGTRSEEVTQTVSKTLPLLQSVNETLEISIISLRKKPMYWKQPNEAFAAQVIGIRDTLAKIQKDDSRGCCDAVALNQLIEKAKGLLMAVSFGGSRDKLDSQILELRLGVQECMSEVRRCTSELSGISSSGTCTNASTKLEQAEVTKTVSPTGISSSGTCTNASTKLEQAEVTKTVSPTGSSRHVSWDIQ